MSNQPDNKSIRDIMLDLVGVQSDSGTVMERAAAERIASYFEEDPYFSMHRDCWGIADTGDHLGRPVVWALKKGTTPRTLILTGHYDAVETESYGDLKPWALKPEELARVIEGSGRADEKIAADLASGDWVFGRGTADMKGGLAIGIHKVLSHPAGEKTGLLFAAVCDEENMSAGARGCVPLLLQIREKFGLEYAATLILEPQLALGSDEFMVYNGSIGKILPAIVTRGVLSHCGEPVKGLSAAHIAAEITCRLDLNCDLTTSDLGLTTQAPIVTMVRDLKTTYDVSVPGYGALMLNLLFLGEGKVGGLMSKIIEICQQAADAVMERYEKAYEHSFRAGLISPDAKVTRGPVVIELGKLEEMAAVRLGADFDALKAELAQSLYQRINASELTLQNASIEYMKKVLEMSGLDGPAIVVGISPPYYPCVCNGYLPGKDGGVLEIVRREAEENLGMKLKVMPYFTGIGDASYMSCTDPDGQRQVMKNLTLPANCYDIPFEDIARLGAPCFFIGPRAFEIHQWSERVYMPDLEKTVPAIIDRLLKEL
ncbi:MAG: M20/M25/M40 family metallo-hydrolase [Firmicutes bacterium]|nr:M20/M25/M40 family metallo-hydrolase [Bacillota bacterium]